MVRRALLLSVAFVAVLHASALAQAPPVLAIWGQAGDPVQYAHPVEICLDVAGNAYVSDVANARVLALTNSGGLIAQWGGPGADRSQPWSITGPKGLAADANGHLLVAEWTTSAPCPTQTGLQEFTVTGGYIASWGACGNTAGPGVFLGAFGVAVGPDGRVYVTDTGLQRLQVFASDGSYITQWPVKGGDVAVDAFDNVIVATGGGVWKFNDAGVAIASWGSAGTGPGQFNMPYGVATDAAGNVYVADTYNDRVQVFTGTGAFVTQWGSAGSAPGQFDRPMGIAVGRDGRIYVADTWNNRIQVFGALPTPTKSESWGKLKAMYR